MPPTSNDSCQLSASGEAGRVRFGMAPMFARACCLRSWERLTAAPDVTNDVVVRDVDVLKALLVAGEIEFFVSMEGLSLKSSAARTETLGQFPLNLIVRTGHPLLHGACIDAKFPVVRASSAGLPVPTEIQDHMRGPAKRDRGFRVARRDHGGVGRHLVLVRFCRDGRLRAGRLCELPRPNHVQPRKVRAVMYTQERRSQSPWARALKQLFRLQIKNLERANYGAMAPEQS